MQAEFATRVHSSLHGIVVPIGVFICFSECNLWPTDANGGEETVFRTNECDSMQWVHATVTSYFTFDLGLILYYRCRMWYVFAIHHVLGILPYGIAAFICPNLPLLLGGAILVEVSNPLMNAVLWCEATKKEGTTLYAVLLHACYVAWLIFRVAIPNYLVRVTPISCMLLLPMGCSLTNQPEKAPPPE